MLTGSILNDSLCPSATCLLRFLPLPHGKLSTVCCVSTLGLTQQRQSLRPADINYSRQGPKVPVEAELDGKQNTPPPSKTPSQARQLLGPRRAIAAALPLTPGRVSPANFALEILLSDLLRLHPGKLLPRLHQGHQTGGEEDQCHDRPGPASFLRPGVWDPAPASPGVLPACVWPGRPGARVPSPAELGLPPALQVPSESAPRGEAPGRRGPERGSPGAKGPQTRSDCSPAPDTAARGVPAAGPCAPPQAHLPDEVGAVAAEGGLLEEAGDEFVVLHLVHILLSQRPFAGETIGHVLRRRGVVGRENVSHGPPQPPLASAGEQQPGRAGWAGAGGGWAAGPRATPGGGRLPDAEVANGRHGGCGGRRESGRSGAEREPEPLARSLAPRSLTAPRPALALPTLGGRGGPERRRPPRMPRVREPRVPGWPRAGGGARGGAGAGGVGASAFSELPGQARRRRRLGEGPPGPPEFGSGGGRPRGTGLFSSAAFFYFPPSDPPGSPPSRPPPPPLLLPFLYRLPPPFPSRPLRLILLLSAPSPGMGLSSTQLPPPPASVRLALTLTSSPSPSSSTTLVCRARCQLL